MGSGRYLQKNFYVTFIDLQGLVCNHHEAGKPGTDLLHISLQAENIKFTLEQQMVFFTRLMGKFRVADDICPIKIDNLD